MTLEQLKTRQQEITAEHQQMIQELQRLEQYKLELTNKAVTHQGRLAELIRWIAELEKPPADPPPPPDNTNDAPKQALDNNED